MSTSALDVFRNMFTKKTNILLGIQSHLISIDNKLTIINNKVTESEEKISQIIERLNIADQSDNESDIEYIEIIDELDKTLKSVRTMIYCLSSPTC